MELKICTKVVYRYIVFDLEKGNKKVQCVVHLCILADAYMYHYYYYYLCLYN